MSYPSGPAPRFRSSFVFWKHLSSFPDFDRSLTTKATHERDFTFTEFYFHPPISMNIIISFVKRKAPTGIWIYEPEFLFLQPSHEYTLFFHCVGHKLNFYNLRTLRFSCTRGFRGAVRCRVHFANDQIIFSWKYSITEVFENSCFYI